MLIKPLLLATLTSTSLLLSTQAYSHLLCAPNGVSITTPHSHSQQVHYVPRITTHTTTTVSAEQHQRFLQDQRIRQQKALANQRRINQQRRAAAQKRQQQIAAQKAKRIAQQQIRPEPTIYINVQQTTHTGCHHTHVHCIAN